MDSQAPGVLVSEMARIWLCPELRPGEEDAIQPAAAGAERGCYAYACPLYVTPARCGTLSTTGHSTNHVCDLELPARAAPEFWARRGTALLLQTD